MAGPVERSQDGGPSGMVVAAALVRFANAFTRMNPADLGEAVVRCCTELGGRDVEVLLADIDQRLLHPWVGGRTTPVPVEDDHAGAAYRSEQVLVASDEGGRRRLWLPVMDSAERLGVLGVTVARTAPLELWRAVGSLVGEAVMSKTAYGDGLALVRRSHSTSLAAELRWSLLPPLTFTSASVEISGFLEPAYDIAGDTFDYAVDDRHLQLAVLDAMGHGLEASRIANLAVGEYRRCRREGLDLATTLGTIDRIVMDQFGESRFVTGQLASLDLRTGALEVLNAGHPRPLLLRDGHDAGDVECEPSPPMGIGSVPSETTVLRLQPGDVLLFHTDGIVEARAPAGEPFGRDRLAALVGAALRAEDRPAEAIRKLVHAVCDHSDGRLSDDASVVMVRWVAPRR